MTLPALTWQAPSGLLALGLIPLFWWAHVRMERHRWRQAFILSTVAATRHAQQVSRLSQRLLYPVVVSLLIGLLSLGMAGPMMETTTSERSIDVMLLLDISLSMMATDVNPSRLAAAQNTAAEFAASLPPRVRLGLTLFAGNSVVVSPPIEDHGRIQRFLHALRPDDLRPRTEIGSAIQAAEQALLTTESSDRPGPEKADVKEGVANTGRVILLLSDGDSREGYPWDRAAQEARQAGIQVDTVAIGRPEPTVIQYMGQMLPVAFSPDTLQQVAQLGGGRFYQAFSQADFQSIYRQLKRQALHLQTRQVSLSPWCCLLALLLWAGYVGGSAWFLFWPSPRHSLSGNPPPVPSGSTF